MSVAITECSVAGTVFVARQYFARACRRAAVIMLVAKAHNVLSMMSIVRRTPVSSGCYGTKPRDLPSIHDDSLATRSHKDS